MAEITYHYSNESKAFEIANFETTVEDYKKWLSENVHADVVIDSEETYKDIYKERTAVRKELEYVKKVDKTISDIILGKFETQCKEIIGLLKPLDEKLTENLETFKPKEPVYSINFKTKNKEVYDKVMALINELEPKEEK